VSGDAEKRSLGLALPLFLALPLAAAAIAAYFLVSGGSDGGVAVAQGSVGGAFHPIAGSFEPDDTSLDDCTDSAYTCLEQGFGNISFRQGPKAALRLFDERIATDSAVQADCHRIAHSIGSAAFARFDGNVGKTFSVGSATCASGYYHGILERAFVGVSTKAKLAKVARTLCVDDNIRRRGFLDYQCRHGLGHGLMIQTGYDLPLALSVCSDLGTGWDAVTCTSGAFMENYNTRYGYRSSWLKDDDPLYPCPTIALEYRESCYLRVAIRVLELNGNDFAKTAQTCAGLAPRWAQFCFRGYGRDAVGNSRYAQKKILALCELAGAAEGQCLYGAARTIGDGFGLQGARDAGALCNRASRADRSACFSGVGLVLGLLYPTNAARRNACAGVAGPYVEPCTEAAIAEVDPSGLETWG
jgi:hypothetical protein